VGHGIYGGGKLTPPPPNGLPYYEGIGIVLEFIQRGALGVIALVLIFLRSLKMLFSPCRSPYSCLVLRRDTSDNLKGGEYEGYLVIR